MKVSRSMSGGKAALLLVAVVLSGCSGDNTAITTGPERDSVVRVSSESTYTGGAWIEITLADAMTLPDDMPARMIGSRIFVPSPEATGAPGKQRISPSEVIDTTLSCIKACGGDTACVKACSEKPKDDH